MDKNEIYDKMIELANKYAREIERTDDKKVRETLNGVRNDVLILGYQVLYSYYYNNRD